MSCNIQRLVKLLLVLVLIYSTALSQSVKQTDTSLLIRSDHYNFELNLVSGSIDYIFSNGSYFNNIVSVFHDVKLGKHASNEFAQHTYTIEKNKDGIEHAVTINFIHEDRSKPFRLVQYITIYKDQPYILCSVAAEAINKSTLLESNYISPFATLAGKSNSVFVNGAKPRLLDAAYDNDNWVKYLTVDWNDKHVQGEGYEFTSLYDYEKMNGIVLGNLSHNFWKTGIKYKTSKDTGNIDDLIVYGGASTEDNPTLPKEFGGYDGTHDVVPHGTMKGEQISSPLVFICYDAYIHNAYHLYGQLNAKISGSLSWNGYAPFYWNSFGIENVLGHKGIMMPGGISEVSDFISSMNNFNRYAKPVISIDSYDQSIYTTEVLASIGKYGEKRNQEMGFYFIPFAVWTWKNSIDTAKLQHTNEYIRNVTLKDNSGKTIIYKDGDFGAFPLDPTHPATRERIIAELQNAKAINAKFLKIDFLSAGAMESTVRYKKNIRSGLEGYNYGMKMLKQLIDSVLGKDIFITQAISPMFPHQYAHARFLSTDIYSHLRDDKKKFPNYGSTASSMITSSHLGWVHGTLLPFTNMDVIVMKNFQRNADISEKDIKIRLYSMITLGSIFGDGTDFRNSEARRRAKKYLDNESICRFFSTPKAFLPLKTADGLDEDQQLSFYLPQDTLLISAFNFSVKNTYKSSFNRNRIGLKHNNYIIKDFITNNTIAVWDKDDTTFSFKINAEDAILFKLYPTN
ncbi:hypothetical protein ACFSPU_13400 [Haoranjiania flava]|uniref:Alpha-galactosidase n=1 Tax=Haoranjiania flava TaxID=1856322 RepID=A0AAE3LNG7_9BACT|nr:hypothetical protein [Haoranjiania flava]MCU7695006.1 hypothetical protein [Haoranjiania flava]